MRKQLHCLHLTHEQVEALRNKGQKIVIQQPSTLIYEGHVPAVAFLIFRGEAFLTKKRTNTRKVNTFSIIGLEELIHHLPLKRNLEVRPDTEVIALDRSTLKEILGDLDHEFHSTLVEIAEVA